MGVYGGGGGGVIPTVGGQGGFFRKRGAQLLAKIFPGFFRLF